MQNTSDLVHMQKYQYLGYQSALMDQKTQARSQLQRKMRINKATFKQFIFLMKWIVSGFWLGRVIMYDKESLNFQNLLLLVVQFLKIVNGKKGRMKEYRFILHFG